MGVPVQFGGTINLNVGNFDATGEQYYPHITGTASGHIFAVWNDSNQHEGAFFRSDGSSTTLIEFNFSNAIPFPASGRADAVALEGGRVAVAWQDNSVDASGDINIAYVGLDGTTFPMPQPIAGAQETVAIAAARNGRTVVVYEGPGDGEDVFYTSYTQFGFGFPQTEVSNGSGSAGDQTNPDIATLQNGDVVMVYYTTADSTIRGTRFGIGESVVLATGVSVSGQIDFAMGITGLATGGFAIVYRDTSNQLTYRVFNDDMTAVTGPLTALAGSQFTPQIVGLQDGRFVIVTASNSNIVGQVFNADGTANSAAFTIDDGAALQNQVFVTLLADGRFAVSYSSDGVADGDGRDVVMKIYDPREAGIILAGTDGDDDYQGSVFADTIATGGGLDLVAGGAGDDVIDGQNNADILRGGLGNDRVYGGAGNDQVFGDGGNDNLFGGWGSDAHDGGADFDFARYDDVVYGNVVVSLTNVAIGTGAAKGDTFTNIEGLIMGPGSDYVYGNSANNFIYSQQGNDNLFGAAGADYLDGGVGFDYARFDDAVYAGLTADLANTIAGTGAAAGDTFVNIEGLILTTNSDFGYGNGGDNFIFGRGGVDVLDGRDGVDFLDGGTGNDTLTGGNGFDTYRFAGVGYGRDTVTLFQGGTGANEKLDLRGCGFANFNAVLNASFQVGADVEIRVNPTDVLVLNNFSKGSLANDDVVL